MRAPALAGLLVHHWQVAWPLDVLVALAAALYLWSARRVRAGWPWGRSAAFLAGLLLVVLALQSGLDSFDDQLLSVHMFQHLILLELAPLLLLSGRPVILALRALRPRERATVAHGLAMTRRISSPIVCLLVYATVVLCTHLPVFFDATLRDRGLHELEHGLYVATGLLLWWPLLDGDPVVKYRLGGLGRLTYVLAAMTPMAVVGALLNRATAVVYHAYGPAARTLGISAVIDQQQAGAFMWVAGSVTLVLVGLCAAMRAMTAEERRQQAQDLRVDRRSTAPHELGA